ncbi:serine hydrolase, partial [Escherichia coli]|nr:serine hydrolase [Escherichia coli]
MKQWFPVWIAVVLLAVVASALVVARADSDMDAQIRDIVASELAPTATAADPGGLAAAVYAGGRLAFFN